MDGSSEVVLTTFRSRDQGLAAVDALHKVKLGGDLLLVSPDVDSPRDDRCFARDVCRRGAIVTPFRVGRVFAIAIFFADPSCDLRPDNAVVAAPPSLDCNSLVGGLVCDARIELERLPPVLSRGLTVLVTRRVDPQTMIGVAELVFRYGGDPVRSVGRTCAHVGAVQTTVSGSPSGIPLPPHRAVD